MKKKISRGLVSFTEPKDPAPADHSQQQLAYSLFIYDRIMLPFGSRAQALLYGRFNAWGPC